MSSSITGHGSNANAGPAVTLKQNGIKAEFIDDSASTMNEGRDLSSTEPNTITVTRKEKAVGTSVVFLNKVENIVASHTDMFPEFKNWQDQAKQILGGVKRPRVLIGVLGYTGSGKSSLINALIDEEMVVPANAMRASTSVVTEISWNDSDDPEKAFRAEIEFISEIEWKMEMDILLGDLKNSMKGEDLSAKSGSEASTAFAKISAVWPAVTLAKLRGMTSEELFQQIDGVSDHLDCILDISDSKAKPFSQQINSYIDSNNKQACAKGMSYWPLVRCVRIYTKAEILRHGLVLVDLPGLGDSNTGRTQVAEKYAKNLNYVWIVADIVRAIDDQIAKDLMGKSFRRQLLMDGKYDDKYVTFIMTKTDIINTEEVVESLQLREKDLRNILAREEKIIKEIHDGQEALDRENFKVKKMRKALKALEKSKPSKAGKPIPRKRKHTEDNRTEVDEQPLADLRTTGKKISKKKLLVKNKAQAVISTKTMQNKLAGLKRTLKLVRNEIKAACTQARNNYTQEHLKMDFENGLRELKQDISDDLNDERPLGNDDDVESKDSVFRQGLVDQLHIFCVSSKGYQKLSGRFKRDRIPEGFATVNDTSIPSLQGYAAASTLTARTKVSDIFLNESNLLKLTIKSWAENDTPNSLSSSQKHALNARLEERIEMLNKSFSHAFDTAMTRIREIIITNILPTLEGCIKASTEKAEQACRNLVNLDTSYQTWKAICRRFGRFSNRKNVNYDWNGVFLEPFLRNLAAPWDQVFNNQMQQIHKEYSRNVVIIINKFSIDIKPLLQDMSEASASNLPIELLAKIPYVNRKITSAVSASRESAQRQAQQIHRLIDPLIQQHLKPAYKSCSRESDVGALSRMKKLLSGHIKQSNEVMYRECSEVLKTRLDKMIESLEKLLAKTHTDTSKYLTKEIGDMIMLAVAKDDEVREKVRNTLRNDPKLELNILEAAWVRGASERTDSLLSVQAEEKPFDESSDDDDNTEDAEDTDASNSSDEVQSISDDVEDS